MSTPRGIASELVEESYRKQLIKSGGELIESVDDKRPICQPTFCCKCATPFEKLLLYITLADPTAC